MAELVYSTDKKKSDYIKMMKAKAANMSDPELKEKILKSLKNKDKDVIRK